MLTTQPFAATASAIPAGLLAASHLAGMNLDIPAAALAGDPVLQRLSDQLGAGDQETNADYADAIRLALAARWLKLRSQEKEEEQSSATLQKWRLKRVVAYIDEHLGESISLADLAKASGLSRMYFASRFRGATGQRPHDYILSRRIERAKELLADGRETLVGIALEVGFQTQAHFTTVFKKFVGTTPGRWRAETLEFAEAA